MGDLTTKGKMQPAPDLFAWGSSQWTDRMIKAPSSLTHYGFLDSGEEKNQKMPAFGGQLTSRDIATVTRFIKGDYDRPPNPSFSSPRGTTKTAKSLPRLPVK